MRCTTRLLLATLLLTLPLFGQYTYYNWNQTMGLADNTSWCASGNCLTSIGGNLLEIKAGPDGTVYGLSTTHTLYTYTKATSWVELASALQTAGGRQIVHISVGGAGYVLAQNNSSPDVYILNSARTAWTLLSGNPTCNDAEIGPDGSVACIGTVAGDTYTYNSSTGVWTLIGNSNANLAVAYSGKLFAVNSSNHELFNWNGSAWTQVSVPFTPSSAINHLAAVGESALAVLDSGGGIHLSTNGGSAWSTIQGAAVAIAGGGATMFTLGSSGAAGYHVNLVVPSLTNTGSGSWLCPFWDPQIGQEVQCPDGASHTLYATSYFGGKGGAHGPSGVTASSAGAPASYLSSPAIENGSLCDPFYGDITSEECTGYGNGSAVCSAMGPLQSFTGGGGSVATGAGVATVGLNWTGTTVPVTPADYGVGCGTETYCTPATTPPLCPGPNWALVYPQVGTPSQTCSAAAEWLLEDPWISYTIGSVTVVACLNPNVGAIPLGKGFGPITCTPKN